MQAYVIQLLGWTATQADALRGEHKKWAVFLIGPPGSGKGTQADLLAERFGLVHIQTSKLGEAKINDSELIKNDPEVAGGKKIKKVEKKKIKKEKYIIRNSSRRVCKASGHPIPNFEKFKNILVCPQDGSEIITRGLDTPETIKTRNEVYHRRTEPIFNFLEKSGYKVIEINGEQSIENVFKDILQEISKS